MDEDHRSPTERLTDFANIATNRAVRVLVYCVVGFAAVYGLSLGFWYTLAPYVLPAGTKFGEVVGAIGGGLIMFWFVWTIAKARKADREGPPKPLKPPKFRM